MTQVRCLALLGLLLATPHAGATDAPPEGATPPARRAVLVTGASTGIGRAITERLAAEGWFVLQAVRLDVTKPAEIAAAVETVTKSGRGLYGLVNNAGVAIRGPLAETREEDFHYVMDVNVYGPYRVTRAFSPLIVAQKGCITTISSISGILSAPGLGVYSMSKHAVEAFGDSLAAEMAPLGVRVSLVEPGNYRSEISRTAALRLGADAALGDRSQYPEPHDVAAAVLHSLADSDPKPRYLVVPVRAEAERTIRKLIEELVQLNAQQPFSYDRGQLVEMLDAALAP
jgi:NAD(P)-dependent dehydrogenase (short-subunit alcohol dehydrogenase family)